MRKVSVVLPILFNKNETQTMLAKKDCAISSDLYMVMVTFSEDYGDLCSYFEDMEMNHEKSKENRNKRNLLDSLLFDDHSKVTFKNWISFVVNYQQHIGSMTSKSEI